MRSQPRAFAPAKEILETATRTDVFWCTSFNYAVSLGACIVRQGIARYDGTDSSPSCARKAPDGHTVCTQGRQVLVQLKRAPKLDTALAESLPRVSIAPRFETAGLPDITPPPPPPAPVAKPPDDYLQKLHLRKPPPAPVVVREEPAMAPERMLRSDPRWREQQGARTKAVRDGKFSRLAPLREAWIAGGRQGPPPEGICAMPGCDSLLRRDSAGTTCFKCRKDAAPAVREESALPDVQVLPDEYLAACVGEAARRQALASLRR